VISKNCVVLLKREFVSRFGGFVLWENGCLLLVKEILAESMVM
jgi:hypothetical protein